MTFLRAPFGLLALAAALLLLGPIRKGDLAGYDDAVYAHIAKAIVQNGEWLSLQSNGFPALEHPPGFVWMQAALFSIFGFSDFLAKLPSALCGVGVVLLVYWLARRILHEERAGLVAMFVMLATPYFIKYASHGMTDVPFTFLFLAAICSWIKSERQPGWYAAVFACTAYALMMRGVAGTAVPLVLAADLAVNKRPNSGLALAALATSFVPLFGWFAHLYYLHGDFLWTVHTSFLKDKFAGDGIETYRRFTGAFEYLWMLTQSYWPWLPFLVIGLWSATRAATHDKDSRLWILAVWCIVVFTGCSIAGSRVLRYMLPAYPAFSIFAAIGLMRVIPQRHLDTGLRWLAPAAACVAAAIALFPPVNLHAESIKPIAAAAHFAAAERERIVFYDSGQPRFDETGQIQWYGDRVMWILTNPRDLDNAISERLARIWIVDHATFEQRFASRGETDVIARSGHLICLRIKGPAAQP